MRQSANTILSFFCLLLVCIVVPAKSFTQNNKLDSLKTVLAHTKDDDYKVRTLLAIGRAYESARDIDNTIKYTKEALALAQQIHFKKGEGNAFFRLGFVYTQINKLYEAKENLRESIRIREAIGDENAGLSYLAMARVYIIENNFPESMNLLLKALQLYEKTGNKKQVALVYWRLAWIYMSYGNYQEALKYISLSNDICVALNLKEHIPGNLWLMSLLNIDLGNDSIANVYINSLFEMAKKDGSQAGIAMANMALSNLLLSQAEDDLSANHPGAAREKLLSAEKSCLVALDDAKQREGSIDNWDVFPLVSIYNTLGKIYLELENFAKARTYIEKGNQLALKINYKGEILKSYKNLNELDSIQGNYYQVLIDYKKYISLRDSVANEANTVKMETARMQYSFDKKEDSLQQQHQLTELKLQSEKKQKYFYWIGLIMLGLLSFLGYTNFRNQKKMNRMADETHAREKAELELHSLRAQLNPHFMFNSLNAIQELILLEEYEKSQSYLARFAKLLRMLLENAEKPFIPLQREIDFLKLYLSLENLRVPDMKYAIHLDPDIDVSKTVIPNMILQPYIENAIWHGLSHKQGERILYINIERHDDMIDYEIKDNGVGRKKAAEMKSLFRREHQSKGMELLSRRFKLLAKEYGSNIETVVNDVISNDEVAGTIVKIEVPMNYSSTSKTA